MVLRNLTLSEWFLRHQLLMQRDHHFYLPIALDVDVSKIKDFFSGRHTKVPMTALLVKAAALLYRQKSWSHRVVFSTFFGPKILEFSEPIVNLPIVLRVDGREVLTAIAIRDADKKSVRSIRDEIQEACKKPLSAYPIANFVFKSKNNFFNRLLLRFICYLAYRLPWFYMNRKGGGICVSSLFNNHVEGFRMRPHAFGPTALTFCFSSVEGDVLKIGTGYDHVALNGNDMAVALKVFSQIIQEELPKILEIENSEWQENALNSGIELNSDSTHGTLGTVALFDPPDLRP